MKKNIIENLFRDNHGVMTSKELIDNGVTYYTIRNLLSSGYITKVKKGIYTISHETESELGLVKKLIPSGVICMQSAAIIYDYTSKVPLRYHISIDNKSKINLPDYPKIKLYYWSKAQRDLGIDKISHNGIDIRIYNKEKTICDYIKFRNKLDYSEVKEVLKSYIRDTDRNISQLKKYSKELRISTVLDHYLESMI